MTFKDHFSAHANRYAAARPGYPDAFFAWLAAQCDAHDVAWDCATGNGQAAVALARHFASVIATDASAEQIANARDAANVSYRVAPAERSQLDDASVDLVTVAQALHWFDIASFWRETQRVLKPGGVVACWGYQLTRIAPDIDAVIDTFDAVVIGVYWPPERRHVDAAYRDIVFPFRALDVPPFEMHVSWSRRQLVDYLSTWSAVRRYREAKGHDPLVWLENELAPFWGADEVRQVTWPMFVRAGVLDPHVA